MSRSKPHRGTPGGWDASYAGPRAAFDAWLTRDLRRQYGQPVSSPLPPDLEAAVNTLLSEDEPPPK